MGALLTPTWIPAFSSPKDIVEAILAIFIQLRQAATEDDVRLRSWPIMCLLAAPRANWADMQPNLPASFLNVSAPRNSSQFAIMADPLSLVSGIAGVVIPALHGMRLLLRDLQDIKDAPKNVQDLKNELSLVDGALSSLQDIEPEDLDSLGPSVGDNIKSTVKVCSTACDKFRADLQRWTRHSQDKKLSWRDRSTIGFWKQDDIKSIQGKLHNCQVNITSVVSTATL